MSGRCIGSDEKVMGILEVSVDVGCVFVVALPPIVIKSLTWNSTIFSVINAVLGQQGGMNELAIKEMSTIGLIRDWKFGGEKWRQARPLLWNQGGRRRDFYVKYRPSHSRFNMWRSGIICSSWIATEV